MASLCFTINDSLIKLLANEYALHQIVFVRSLTGVLILSFVMVFFPHNWKGIKTKRFGLHIARALCVVFANLFFYMALADLKLAEVVGIFFIAPFLISIFSILFLGEYVGPQRWAAIILGFMGVMLIVKPGTDAFSPVAIFPMIAASCYAGFHIFTRKMADTETLFSMTFYPPLVFVFVSSAIGLVLASGAYSVSYNQSLAFLTRAWILPSWGDLSIMALIGFGITLGGYSISRAYRGSEAALIAPFEYSGLIYAAILGYIFFDEWPNAVSVCGMGIVIGSGLFMIWREYVNAHKSILS